MTPMPDKSGRQQIPPQHPSELEASSLKAVLEHSEDAIFCKTLNNIVTLWSRGAERVYGYTSEEMIGQSVDRLLPPDRLRESKQLIARVAAGEHVEHFETLRITQSGATISVLLNLTPLRDASGRVTGAVTIARDTSATKEAQASAREAQQQFQVTFEEAAIGIAHVAADGRWLRVNARLCAIVGYSPSQLCDIVTNPLGAPPANTLQAITHVEDLPAEMRDIRRVLAGEINAYSMEKRYLRPGGQTVWVYQTVSLVRDSSGAPKYFLAFVEDISKRKLADDRLRPLEKQGRDRGVVLDTANRVALDVLSQLTGVEALRHIASAARTLANARYAAIGVARLDGQGLSEFVTVGLTPDEEARIGHRPEGLGVLGHLLHRREPLRIDSLASHSTSVGFPANHPPMESFLGVPICRGEVVLGSLYLTNKEGGGPFTEEDELAVQALGAYAAVAINSLEMIARQRDLVRGLIVAQEDERRAVAYDLHDGLTQYVMASQAHFEAFRRAKEADKTERAERELEQGLTYLKEAVSESRRLVNGLRSLALDDLGLAGALEQHLGEEKTRAGWAEAEFVHNIAGRRFDQTLETAVYRVAQEALTNARKHAGAQHVRLLLLLEGDGADETARLNLEVRDWGRGFVPEKIAADAGRVGLHSMSERVGLMNGVYQLVTSPGQGATVRARFPIVDTPAVDGAANTLARPGVSHEKTPFETVGAGEGSKEILELNSEMRQINEQLLISGLQQQTLADQNRIVAEAIHYSSLRRRPEKLLNGIQISAHYEPAARSERIAGSLSDAFALPNNSIMLLAGDVTGTETDSAVRSLEIRHVLRAFARDDANPAHLMTRLNAYVCDSDEEDEGSGVAHIVLTLVAVDPITGAVQAVSAGSAPPLVLRASGEIEELSARGSIIGIDRRAVYELAPSIIQERDILLLATDAIMETIADWGSFNSVQHRPDGQIAVDPTLADLGKSIVASARAHGAWRAGGDACLLLAQRNCPPHPEIMRRT